MTAKLQTGKDRLASTPTARRGIITLGEDLGLKSTQTIEPKIIDGRLLPLVIIDFDGTVCQTMPNCFKATEVLVRNYTGSASQIPTLSEFQSGKASLSTSSLRSWGVPEDKDWTEIWSEFACVLTRFERESPSRLFPGVAEALQDMDEHLHVIVVTLNHLHPVSQIIQDQAGVKVDTVVVRGDKTRVLRDLVKHHRANAYKSGVPLRFFGDTTRDMADARNANEDGSEPKIPVVPVGVLHAQNHADRENYRMALIMSGAEGVVGHDQIADVALGILHLSDLGTGEFM